jgi:hypothetical protein
VDEDEHEFPEPGQQLIVPEPVVHRDPTPAGCLK